MKYTTYWVSEALANKPECLAQHQRTFPGNVLAIVYGMVKVAVSDGEKPPIGATTISPKGPTVPMPKDGKKYAWNEPLMQWIEAN